MKKYLLSISFVFISFCAFAVVKFPSQQQPKKAKISSTTNSWSLSNNLFSATYTLGNGNLFFAGSDVFGLNKSNELFRITLADGTEKENGTGGVGFVVRKEKTGNAAGQRDKDVLEKMQS